MEPLAVAGLTVSAVGGHADAAAPHERAHRGSTDATSAGRNGAGAASQGSGRSKQKAGKRRGRGHRHRNRGDAPVAPQGRRGQEEGSEPIGEAIYAKVVPLHMARDDADEDGARHRHGHKHGHNHEGGGLLADVREDRQSRFTPTFAKGGIPDAMGGGGGMGGMGGIKITITGGTGGAGAGRAGGDDNVSGGGGGGGHGGGSDGAGGGGGEKNADAAKRKESGDTSVAGMTLAEYLYLDEYNKRPVL